MISSAAFFRVLFYLSAFRSYCSSRGVSKTDTLPIKSGVVKVAQTVLNVVGYESAGPSSLREGGCEAACVCGKFVNSHVAAEEQDV